MSACLCNVLVNTWARRMVQAQVVPSVYLDDRTVSAHNLHDLERAWRLTQDWDHEVGWLSHRTKTCLAFAPRAAPCPDLKFDSGEQVAVTPSIQTLGHDVPFRYQSPRIVQTKRTRKAVQSCLRIELLRLPTPISQRLVSTVVMKQFNYGIQSVVTPSRDLKILRASIKKATATHYRRHSWAALSALIQHPEAMDPVASTMYSHLLSLVRSLRQGERAWEQWVWMRSYDVGKRSQGPRKVTQIYWQRLGVTESEDGESWSAHDDAIRIREELWPALKHKLRHWIRLWLLHLAQQQHPNLTGCTDICVETSTKLWKKGHCSHPATLAALMCDGIWTTYIRFRAGWVSSPQCPFCGEKEEDIEHVIHKCSAWQKHRVVLAAHAPWFEDQEASTRACLLCPMNAPPHLKKIWGTLQLETVGILQVRECSLRTDHQDALGPRQPERITPPQDEPLWRPLEMKDMASSKPFIFELRPCFTRGKHKWMYSIAQWQMINAYFADVRVMQGDLSMCPRCSVIEMYVSYVLWGKGQRFESQLPDANRGHWLSTQIERFRNAVVTWNHITEGPILFEAGQGVGHMTDWGGRLGLPKFQNAQVPIIVPLWAEARAWIDALPQHLHVLTHQGPAKEAWRRIPFGNPGTQMKIDQSLLVLPLHARTIPRLRMRFKQECVP